jgi:intraflagellar transport protein 140
MTLFFDTKVQFLDNDTISTIVVFHPNEPIFAVAGFGENRGGSVTLFEDSVNFIIPWNGTEINI